MDVQFWKEMWAAGRTGFHEGKPNSLLEEWVDKLGAKRRVLVPLCGKAEDMAFLASRGHEVVGIEIVEDAVRAFYDEHRLVPEVTAGDRVRRYHAQGVTILVGDLFACTREDAGIVDALYDRASIVALPPELRARYVPHVRALLEPKARGLIVTFTYDQAKMEGPPFSVTETEIRNLYAGATIERLTSRPDVPRPGGRFEQLGITAEEHIFALEL